MKMSGTLIASVAAASATAITSSSSDLFHSPTIHPSTKNLQEAAASREDRDVSRISSSSTEKFAPKFDGLRFIETLVTAHR